MMKKKKMLVICPHPENIAPGQRLKYEQYFEHWRSNGYDVKVSPFFSERMQSILYTKGRIPEKIYWVIRGYLKRIREFFTLQRYDLVYIFLWVTPFGLPVMEKLFVSKNTHVVYDIDDAIFLKTKSLTNRLADFIKGRSKPFFMMKHAKHVIACTPFLTDVAKKYNERVTDISSTINTHTYQPVNSYQNDHVLTLGWSGSHSTSQFLYLLKDILIELNNRKPFKLLVMGDPHFKINELDMQAIKWTNEDEIPTLQKFDIGLYPLPLDSDWVLGKSGLKALQYMAVGVPVVATAIGANYRIIENNKTGILVKTKEEWLTALEYLMDNPSTRQSIGLSGRNNVVDNYSIDANAPVYLSILNTVCKK
ncbi:glycosyltransferase family 4 protein [Ferruginibacter albus]|uniref:glycosyltransferase family 4 protein n=1 Tax=Ferruginibacter albus TaxID=2875540 RepID=UPI001CC5921F|nr:glycosyltransferase [Ferruginibacter albus]UAY52223.1 glycosyltransferase [Ferruginibacter albus]